MILFQIGSDSKNKGIAGLLVFIIVLVITHFVSRGSVYYPFFITIISFVVLFSILLAFNFVFRMHDETIFLRKFFIKKVYNYHEISKVTLEHYRNWGTDTIDYDYYYVFYGNNGDRLFKILCFWFYKKEMTFFSILQDKNPSIEIPDIEELKKTFPHSFR